MNNFKPLGLTGGYVELTGASITIHDSGAAPATFDTRGDRGKALAESFRALADHLDPPYSVGSLEELHYQSVRSVTPKCSLLDCRTKGKFWAANVRVNKNIDDQSNPVLICTPCAVLLGVSDGDDLPEPDECTRLLKGINDTSLVDPLDSRIDMAKACRDADTLAREDEPTMPTRECELKDCIFDNPAEFVRVYDIVGDGAYSTLICNGCALVLGLKAFDNLPFGDKITEALIHHSKKTNDLDNAVTSLTKTGINLILDNNCPKCGGELKCLGGESAHSNNWYCKDEEKCGW